MIFCTLHESSVQFHVFDDEKERNLPAHKVVGVRTPHCVNFEVMMQRLRQRAAMMLVHVAVLSCASYAQESGQEAGVIIVSQPSETIIRLEGDYAFAGKAPFSIPQTLTGYYTLSASKRGYESKSMKFYFDDKPFHKISLNLQPISRMKAGFKSLLLPGAGQRYKGASTRGLLFTGLALGAGIGALATQLKYSSDLDDMNQARRDYEQNQNNFELAQAAYQNWQSAYQRAQDSYDRRQRSLAITAVVWGISFLDALLMPPGPGSDRNTPASLSGRLGFNQSQVELHFSF
jgi:hypothetical protein